MWFEVASEPMTVLISSHPKLIFLAGAPPPVEQSLSADGSPDPPTALPAYFHCPTASAVAQLLSREHQ